jgi:hypothetical protein
MAVLMTVATAPLLTLIGVPKAPRDGHTPTGDKAAEPRLGSYAALPLFPASRLCSQLNGQW